MTNLPKVIDVVASLDPLSYGVDGLRGALIGNSFLGPMLDLMVLSIIAAALLGAGSYLFSRIQLSSSHEQSL